jgi:hypothetical protein
MIELANHTQCYLPPRLITRRNHHFFRFFFKLGKDATSISSVVHAVITPCPFEYSDTGF